MSPFRLPIFFRVLFGLLALGSFCAISNTTWRGIPFWILLSFCQAVFGVLLVVEGIPLIKPLLNRQLRKRANYLRANTVDFGAKLLSFALLPFPQSKYNPVDDEGGIPTLFIHGYLVNSGVWFYHRFHYRCAGLRNLFTVDLGATFESIETHAQTVRNKIQQICALTQQNKIRLIGHSMGGVVAAYYILHLAEQDDIQVTDLITMGSPFYGTPMGVFGIGISARQMTTASPFIEKLSQKLESSHIRSFHQGSVVDLIVFPFNSTIGRAEGERKLKRYNDLGHASFLYSDRAIKEVIQFLQSRSE